MEEEDHLALALLEGVEGMQMVVEAYELGQHLTDRSCKRKKLNVLKFDYKSYEGVDIFDAPPLRVTFDTSAMIWRASLHAWYIRNISSLFRASSALSSIMFCYRK